MKKKILLYGFGGYLNFTRNPSRELVKELNRQTWPGVQVTSFIFNVSYADAREQVIKVLRKGPFAAAVGFGLASGSGLIRLEQTARNSCDSPKPDRDGKTMRRRVILRNQPDVYRTSVKLFNLRKMLLKENIPTVISKDAGGYLCNFTYYLMSHHLRQDGSSAPCLFVHIPFSSEIVCRQKRELASFPQSMLNKAGRIIVTEIRDRHLRP